MRAHQQAPPATGEGDIEAQPLTHMEQLGLQMQAAIAIMEAARAALQDQEPSAFVLHPGQLQLMNEIADTVLLTNEDKLQMLGQRPEAVHSGGHERPPAGDDRQGEVQVFRRADERGQLNLCVGNRNVGGHSTHVTVGAAHDLCHALQTCC